MFTGCLQRLVALGQLVALILDDEALLFRPNQAIGRADHAGDQGQQDQQPCEHRPLVPPHKLPQPVCRRRRTRLHRFIRQVALYVHREAVGGLVAAVAVLLQRLHHDPIQFATHQLRQPRRLRPPVGGQRRQAVRRAQLRARFRRLLLADHPEHLQHAGLGQLHAPERRAAGQQLVQQHPQRVDVAPRVDVELVDLRLLGRHVFQRADDRPEPGDQRPVGQLWPGRLGHAEVDDLRHRLAVIEGDQHVGGLEVAVDDALLMRVLHRLADRDEQLQPLPRREVVLVAVAGDGHPLDQIHDEVRPADAGGAGVQHAGDVGVVHQGQSLAFGLEAGDDLAGVHAGLDQLDGDEALDRLGLLGHPDAAHAALADRLDELVRADHRAGALRGRLVDGRLGSARQRAVQQAVGADRRPPAAPRCGRSGPRPRRTPRGRTPAGGPGRGCRERRGRSPRCRAVMRSWEPPRRAAVPVRNTMRETGAEPVTLFPVGQGHGGPSSAIRAHHPPRGEGASSPEHRINGRRVSRISCPASASIWG